MLTSTVMIRRMKADMLKNLPTKIREKAYVKIEDEGLKNEFRTYMVCECGLAHLLIHYIAYHVTIF